MIQWALTFYHTLPSVSVSELQPATNTINITTNPPQTRTKSLTSKPYTALHVNKTTITIPVFSLNQTVIVFMGNVCDRMTKKTEFFFPAMKFKIQGNFNVISTTLDNEKCNNKKKT